MAGVGIVAAGMLMRRDEEDRRRREEEEARRALFSKPKDDDEDEDPWDAHADDGSDALPVKRESDKSWASRIDALCERLFNGPEEDRDLLTSDDEPILTPLDRQPGRSCVRLLGTSSAVAPPRAAPRLLPSPGTIRRMVAGEGLGVRARGNRCAPITRRSRFGRGAGGEGALRSKPETATARPLSRSRPRWLAFFLLLASCLLLWRIPFGEHGQSPPRQTLALAQPEGKYVTSNIEDLRVGDWVLARNPEISDQEREEADAGLEDEDTPEWRTIALRMEKPHGDRVNITVVRPLEWLEENAATPGATVELDVEELGAAGPAEVLSIGPCPDIAPRPSADCRVVTGTFAHQSAHVLDLTIEGLDEPIGVTTNHPFWSDDREAFIPAGQLRPGELLRALDGLPHRVVSITPRAGTHSVYNLEVDGEHVYLVSTSGVLVHNNCAKKANSPKQPKPPSWTTARRNYWKARAANAAEGEFSAANLDKMRLGKAPAHDKLEVPMELHHSGVPQRNGGAHTPGNLRELWPWQHAEVDPFRYYNGPGPSGS